MAKLNVIVPFLAYIENIINDELRDLHSYVFFFFFLILYVFSVNRIQTCSRLNEREIQFSYFKCTQIILYAFGRLDICINHSNDTMRWHWHGLKMVKNPESSAITIFFFFLLI